MNIRIQHKPTLLRNTLTAFAAIAVATCGFSGQISHGSHGSDKSSDLNTATRASSIDGMDLLSKDGKELGIVDDIVIDSSSGKVEALVVDTGFLGFGGPVREVGISELETPKLKPYDMKTGLTQEGFQQAPVFDPDSLERSTDSDTNIESGQILAVDTMSRHVENKDGDYFGYVHDWIVDMSSGYAPYAIIMREDPLATHSFNYFAVSVDRIEGMKDGNVVISLSEDDIDNAEDLDANTPLKIKDMDASVYQFSYRDPDMLSQN